MVELNKILADFITSLRLRGYTVDYDEKSSDLKVKNKNGVEVEIQLTLGDNQKLSIEFFTNGTNDDFVHEVADLFSALINNHLHLEQ